MSGAFLSVRTASGIKAMDVEQAFRLLDLRRKPQVVFFYAAAAKLELLFSPHVVAGESRLTTLQLRTTVLALSKPLMLENQ